MITMSVEDFDRLMALAWAAHNDGISSQEDFDDEQFLNHLSELNKGDNNAH